MSQIWEIAAGNNAEKYGKMAVNNFKKKQYGEGIKDALISAGCIAAVAAKEILKHRR